MQQRCLKLRTTPKTVNLNSKIKTQRSKEKNIEKKSSFRSINIPLLCFFLKVNVYGVKSWAVFVRDSPSHRRASNTVRAKAASV